MVMRSTGQGQLFTLAWNSSTTLPALQGTTPFPDMVDGINTRGEAWAHLVFTVEEFNSLQSDSQITFLRADFRMPAWEKAILSLNPSDGVNVMSYHLTELHSATRRPNVWILLSFQIDFAHLANTQSYDQVRMFNRAHAAGGEHLLEVHAVRACPPQRVEHHQV